MVRRRQFTQIIVTYADAAHAIAKTVGVRIATERKDPNRRGRDFSCCESKGSFGASAATGRRDSDRIDQQALLSSAARQSRS